MKKNSNNKSSIDYYFLPNKICCGMIGIWPIDDKSSKRSKQFAYVRLVVGFMAVSSVFVPQVMLAALNYNNVGRIAELGCVLATIGQLLFRMIYFIARKGRAYKLYYELRNLWDSSDDPVERQPYEELANYARICTIIFYFTCMCNVTTFTIAATVDYIKSSYNYSNVHRRLPVEVWYGIDISPSPYFEVFFGCQIVTISMCAAGVSGLDGTFMAIIMHVAGQFRLTSVWISRLGIKINCEPYYLPKIQADLIKCVRHHKRIINVVNDVNNLLTPVIFVQLLTSGIQICLSGFAMVSYTAGTEQLRFITYFISLELQLVLLCWPGEILIQESQAVGYTAYFDVPWYNLPYLSQKQFCLLIIRAQQYCSISVLTFSTLSMRTLTNVFNTAVSFFTLLRETQQS